MDLLFDGRQDLRALRAGRGRARDGRPPRRGHAQPGRARPRPRGRGRAAWLVSAAVFVVWMLLDVVDDELTRAEVGLPRRGVVLVRALAVVYRPAELRHPRRAALSGRRGEWSARHPARTFDHARRDAPATDQDGSTARRVRRRAGASRRRGARRAHRRARLPATSCRRHGPRRPPRARPERAGAPTRRLPLLHALLRRSSSAGRSPPITAPTRSHAATTARGRSSTLPRPALRRGRTDARARPRSRPAGRDGDAAMSRMRAATTACARQPRRRRPRHRACFGLARALLAARARAELRPRAPRAPAGGRRPARLAERVLAAAGARRTARGPAPGPTTAPRAAQSSTVASAR